MYISSVILHNFRSYDLFRIDLKREGNVFCGSNGIGKTNLLEAICYFAYGKSFRANSDIDLIKHGCDNFHIKGSFSCGNEPYLFEAACDGKGNKTVKINNRRIERISELYKLLKIVFFSQEDINIITGPPKKRRHFFDHAISQLDYRYIECLKAYNQTVKQRNSLFKGTYSSKEKKVWDERLIETAVAVLEMRKNYLLKINEELAKNNVLHDEEHIGIEYRHSFRIDLKKSLFEQLNNELKKAEQEELLFKRTLIGPHLDDYIFLLNGHYINRFGSHGQQRSFIIVLGIARSRLISRTDNDLAIMIFDDVLSDLDHNKTGAILASLSNGNQIFIATPNPSIYSELGLEVIDIEATRQQSQADPQ